MTTNPTDPTAVEAWRTANEAVAANYAQWDETRQKPGNSATDAAATVIQSYGDQREADARAASADRIGELEARVKMLIKAGNGTAFAAGALNIATDRIPHLRGERGLVLDALKAWSAALREAQ